MSDKLPIDYPPNTDDEPNGQELHADGGSRHALPIRDGSASNTGSHAHGHTHGSAHGPGPAAAPALGGTGVPAPVPGPGYGGYGGYGGGYGYGAGYDAPPEPGDEIHLLDYARILYKRRWSALTILLVVFLGVAAYTLTRTPVYDGRVQLMIEPESKEVVSFKDVLPEQSNYASSVEYYQTQYRILQSRKLARRTLETLSLWDSPHFGGGDDQEKSFSAGAVVSSATGWVTGLFTNGDDGKEAPLPGESERESRIIDSFLDHLSVSPIRNSRLVDVRFASTDRNLAARAANALAQAYIDQSLEFRFTASKAASDWLEEQLAEQRKKVEASELALQKYREQGDAVALEDRQNVVVQRFAELNAAQTRARTERIEKEAQYKRLLALQEDRLAIDTFPAILSNAFIQELKAELASLQRERAKLAETYGEKHSRMIELQSAIEAGEARLQGEIAKVVQAVRNEYLAAEAQERSLTDALDKQKAEVLALNRSSITYGVLRREAESNQQIYNSLMERAKESGVSSELRASNIHVVDAAEVPRTPARPRKAMNLFLGLFAGCVLGAGGAFILERLDSRIKSPEEIKALGLPFLGLIPVVNTDDLAHRSPLLTKGVPAGFAEALRLIRTNVLFSFPDTAVRSIVVTSAAPGEGKTQVAANLAIGLAQAGERVVLVDADMRRPRVHEVLDIDQAPGLSEVITGQVKASASVVKAEMTNLWVLPGGTNPPNPSELLGSDRLGSLLSRLTEHFDWVVIDTPPVMAVTDASLVAHRAGGVLMVVGSDEADRHAVEQAIEQLSAARARFVGGVLNRANVERHRYYYARYYRREYADYYQETSR